MRHAVSTRLLASVFVLALAAAACGASEQAATIDLGSGREFVPAVVDSVDNVGLTPSVALDDSGSPFMSYFGFPEELETGEIPVSRSVYAPFVPSVLLATVEDGIFTRGAVAMSKPPPNLVNIPFGPAIEKSVETMTPEGVNGTSLAIDGQGGIHVAWVSNTGLWYGEGGGSSAFSVEPIVRLPSKVKEAGPLGWPAVAVDQDDNVWIAYGDDTGATQTVQVAIRSGGKWTTQEVASLGPCGGCPPPRRVAIGITRAGPVVAYSDAARGATVAAISDGRTWQPQDIEAGADGIGLSMAVDGDGGALAAYYTGDGSVHQAAFDGGGWTAGAVADVGEAESERPETTGVAMDGDGTAYITWYDPATDSVALASNEGGSGSFAPIETPGTMGGSMPAVEVLEDGSQVFVTWYDHVNGNLVLGTLAEVNELALAKPSPTTSATAAPAASPTGGKGGGPPCESTGTTADIAAPAGAAAAGYDTQCLAVDADKAVEVTFDNQDPGVPHNWALFEDAEHTKPIEGAATPLTPGPTTETADVPPLDKGTYYFHCDAHPTTMTGQFYTG
jgi:hypothetical protein